MVELDTEMQSHVIRNQMVAAYYRPPSMLIIDDQEWLKKDHPNIEGDYLTIINSMQTRSVKNVSYHGVCRDDNNNVVNYNVGLFSLNEDYISASPGNKAMRWYPKEDDDGDR